MHVHIDKQRAAFFKDIDKVCGIRELPCINKRIIGLNQIKVTVKDFDRLIGHDRDIRNVIVVLFDNTQTARCECLYRTDPLLCDIAVTVVVLIHGTVTVEVSCRALCHGFPCFIGPLAILDQLIREFHIKIHKHLLIEQHQVCRTHRAIGKVTDHDIQLIVDGEAAARILIPPRVVQIDIRKLGIPIEQEPLIGIGMRRTSVCHDQVIRIITGKNGIDRIRLMVVVG